MQIYVYIYIYIYVGQLFSRRGLVLETRARHAFARYSLCLAMFASVVER